MISNQLLHHYPLSLPQDEILRYQLSGVPSINIGGAARIDGPIDPVIFEQAINQVIQENDALRIKLHADNTQTIMENVCIEVDYRDFSAENNAEQQVIEWMQNQFVEPFQIYGELLFKFALCKVSKDCYYGFQKYHHSISDGLSNLLIPRRIADAYNALITGCHIEPQSYSYLEFVKDDQIYRQSKKFIQDKLYWLEKYQQLPEPLITPRHDMPKLKKHIPCQQSILCLKRDFYDQLINFAEEHHTSIFHICLGVLYCYFLRNTDRDDFAIGTSTLNRSNAAFRQTVGMFVSVSPVWFSFNADLSFIELIATIGRELKRDYRHQRFPFSELIKQLDLHQRSLFDISLVYASYAKYGENLHFNGNPTETIRLSHDTIPHALFIFIGEFYKNEDVNVNLNYNLWAFSEDDIEHFKTNIEFLLSEIVQRPNVPVKKLQESIV